MIVPLAVTVSFLWLCRKHCSRKFRDMTPVAQMPALLSCIIILSCMSLASATRRYDPGGHARPQYNTITYNHPDTASRQHHRSLVNTVYHDTHDVTSQSGSTSIVRVRFNLSIYRCVLVLCGFNAYRRFVQVLEGVVDPQSPYFIHVKMEHTSTCVHGYVWMNGEAIGEVKVGDNCSVDKRPSCERLSIPPNTLHTYENTVSVTLDGQYDEASVIVRLVGLRDATFDWRFVGEFEQVLCVRMTAVIDYN
jgi:hypothetical protein